MKEERGSPKRKYGIDVNRKSQRAERSMHRGDNRVSHGSQPEYIEPDSELLKDAHVRVVYLVQDIFYHAKCELELAARGINTEEELSLYCTRCRESVFIPLVSVDRIEVRG